MAARKKSSAKKARARAKVGRMRNPLADLDLEMPTNWKEYTQQLRKVANRLEKEIERANVDARRRFAKALRTASTELGRLEERGEKAWKRGAKAATRDAQRMLGRLARSIEPKAAKKRAAARKKAAGRKTGARKRATA